MKQLESSDHLLFTAKAAPNIFCPVLSQVFHTRAEVDLCQTGQKFLSPLWQGKNQCLGFFVWPLPGCRATLAQQKLWKLMHICTAHHLVWLPSTHNVCHYLPGDRTHHSSNWNAAARFASMLVEPIWSICVLAYTKERAISCVSSTRSEGRMS